MITFVVHPTSEKMWCISMKNEKTFDYNDVSKFSNWEFKNPDKSKAINGSTHSFVNQALKELQIMHIICCALLFFSMFSFRNQSGTAINLSSVLRILSVPIYITVLYRAEEAIRKYRTVYAGNTLDDVTSFKFASWKDSTKSGGSTCFFNNNGNALYWLWIELYAFLG